MPFPLRAGRLFHALVRDAGASGDPADLEARVYSSAYDGSDMRLEAAVGLGYPRGGLRQAASDEAMDLAWRPWADTVPPSPVDALSVGPQPMAADIVFDRAGNLILGLRDRLVDLTDPALAAGSELAIGAGDLLLARREGDRCGRAHEGEALQREQVDQRADAPLREHREGQQQHHRGEQVDELFRQRDGLHRHQLCSSRRTTAPPRRRHHWPRQQPPRRPASRRTTTSASS